ncbi:MAG TPA: amino acid adenylation domain-containing protein, partial [Terriglobales bacterium]|nr:amino acid adenylation domain-containing protein [Terriglobales bacterium]
MSMREAPAALSAEAKRKRLTELLRRKAEAENSKAPLSYGQRSLLYLNRLAPDSPAYNALFTVKLSTRLDLDALRKAFEQLVARHPVLRTTYHSQGDAPYQTIHPCMEVPFEVKDASTLNHDQLQSQITEAAQTRFRLESGPLLRVTLFSKCELEHTLLIVIHHIACDYWSLVIMADEVAELYSALCARRGPALPQLSYNYADYVRWQQETLAGRSGDRLWSYWQQELAGDVPVLDLPTDRPRPSVQSFDGAACEFKISDELTGELRELAKRLGTTLFTLMLSAYYVLLFRYTGQAEIIVGTTTAGRDRSEVENLIGYFVNPVVLRARCGGGLSFREFLSQVQEKVLEALDHQAYPFPLLVERLDVKRDPARSPLTDVFFSWDKSHRRNNSGAEEQHQLKLQPFYARQSGAPHDLILIIFEEGTSLSALLQYNTNLWEARSARRMLGHYENLLRGIVKNAETPLWALPLMNDEERIRVTEEWNRTQREYPRDKTLAELFEEQVKRGPGQVAVVYGNQSLTYGELNRRANQLAHYLRGRGVKRQELVGLSLRRSPEMIVGLLGIVKAGGAYVPLDAEYPLERLRYMQAETELRLIVSEKQLAEKLPPAEGTEIIFLDGPENDAIGKESGENPRERGQAEDLAYVMYTSGSTGRPKGVCIPQRAVVRLVRGTDYVTLGPDEVLLQYAPVSFDAATFEIWGALLNGGRLAVMEAGSGSLVELGRALKRHGVTTLWLTAGLFHLMVEERIEDLRGVKQLLAGGDVLSVQAVKKITRELPQCHVINGYGPTENTTFTCCFAVDRSQELANTLPIGRGIANTQVYVLDEHRQAAPVGVAGEIYAGGDGLAQGYWKRAELTKERFVEHPFRAGERLYRTGDMGRWREDGVIEFLGRKDQQVKVRGYRIELGEIEAALREVAGVEQAVVVARSEGGEKRLVGYVVGSGPELEASAVREQVRQKLPEYMVPGEMVVLKELPLTANGKVDRERLPQPRVSRREEGAEGRSRSDSTVGSGLEEKIAQVWREVLGREQVGVEENFFDLGGHSLRMMQVHSRLQKELELGRELGMVELFQYPTVRSLARHLGGGAEEKRGQRDQRRRRTKESRGEGQEEIAIIGMAGRFAGARDVEELWGKLAAGEESIREFTEEELLAAGVEAELLRHPDYVKAGTVLEGADLFDAQFFGFNPREAALTDPQHRLFLECAYQALEVAGYDAQRYEGRIGVYAGSTLSSYLLKNVESNKELLQELPVLQKVIGNDKDFVPSRVAYKLNLKGPAVNVQTACSTSLVAVHLACQALREGACEMALAGGVSLQFPQPAGYMYMEEGIGSRDGHCRAFDAQATGTVAGQGAGIVVLKRLEEALEDGDNILAVIKGSAINNDGAAKVGYTAPSVAGQAEVIGQALAAAGVGAETISYVEAHGTGTRLGDPIEVAALTQAYRRETNKQQYCGLGSIKTNLGHLDAAAGVTGLIKTVLQLREKKLAPSLHYEEGNGEIDFANSPFYVNRELREWERKEGSGPRRAGVSSFGIGGTNAHVVVEEAPERGESELSEREQEREWELLVLSAKTESALTEAGRQLAEHLGQRQERHEAI